MADRLAELRDQQAALDADLAEVRAQMKAAKQKRHSAARKAKKAWQLTEHVSTVALMVYVLAGYAFAPAVKYLVGEAEKKKWPAKPEDEVQDLVGNVFLCTSERDIADLCDLRNPKNPGAAKVAARVAEEWRLAAWVESLNLDRGVAPSADTVLQRWEHQRQALPEGVRPAPRGSAAEPKARMWLMRLRRRLGGRYGRIPPRDDVPLEDMRAKARARHADMFRCACFLFTTQ